MYRYPKNVQITFCKKCYAQHFYVLDDKYVSFLVQHNVRKKGSHTYSLVPEGGPVREVRTLSLSTFLRSTPPSGLRNPIDHLMILNTVEHEIFAT